MLGHGKSQRIQAYERNSTNNLSLISPPQNYIKKITTVFVPVKIARVKVINRTQVFYHLQNGLQTATFTFSHDNRTSISSQTHLSSLPQYTHFLLPSPAIVANCFRDTTQIFNLLCINLKIANNQSRKIQTLSPLTMLKSINCSKRLMRF